MTAADQYPAIKFTTPLAPLHGMVNVQEWKRKWTLPRRADHSFVRAGISLLLDPRA
jgi:hypothetical protein